MPYDLVIRGGLLVDGGGGEPQRADVAVRGDRVAAVGEVSGPGVTEIDASGCHVTPGFVDIHTHYDAQVTWSNRLAPSNEHGVTTVLLGSCGVGFAPCRPGDRDKLRSLMEGVEDIPEAVMVEGMPWGWETFPDYLDFLAGRSYDADICAYIPHSPLRLYVMGERAMDLEPATAEDIARMAQLAREALDAGAVGFATSLSVNHKTREGGAIFTRDAGQEELIGIAASLQGENGGVFQGMFDIPEGRGCAEKFADLHQIARASRAPLSFTVAQFHEKASAWRTLLGLIDDANREDGLEIRAQVLPRPLGVVLGHDLSFNPFSPCPSYRPLARLPLADKVRALRAPELRRRLIAEASDPNATWLATTPYGRGFDMMFVYDDPPDYDFGLDNSIGAMARRQGLSPQALAYDLLLRNDGRQMLFAVFANYADGDMDAAWRMLRDPNTLIGLGDGGAHYGLICDASYPTFILSYYGRDADPQRRVALGELVRKLTLDNAAAIGLRDRGLVRPGYRADLNVIDLDRLRLHAPSVAYDLPAGGRRMSQRADGFVATVLAGKVTRRDGVATGALPGRLVRRNEARAPA